MALACGLDPCTASWFHVSMKTVLLMLLSLTFSAMPGSVTHAAEPKTQKPFPLTTLSGTTYQNCRIVKVTPESITVMHDAGVTRVSFENLGEAWRRQFNYDPAKARAYAQEEADRANEAEAARQAASRRRQQEESQRMAELVAMEKRREAELTAIAILGPPIAPAPLPGDPTPQLGATPAVEDSGVPVLAPISGVHTPGSTYRTYSRDRYGDYHDGGWYPYLPVYGSGFGVYPVRPAYACPVPYARPAVRVTVPFRGGGGVIRVSR